MLENQIIKSPNENFKERYFILKNLLGTGVEGEVYEAKAENQSFYNSNVAIKIFNQIKETEEEFIDWIIEYQRNYEKIQTSFLVKTYEKFTYNSKTCVVMELGCISLKEYLNSNNIMRYYEKEQICLKISKSVQFLHSYNYFHRDIKPDNYVKIGDQYRLTDFGMLKAIKFQFKRQTVGVGTLQYQAPETTSEIYSQPADIWSLGCLFYEIFSGEQLFSGKKKTISSLKEELKQNNQENQLTQKIKQIKWFQWSNLILNMLNPNPDYRPKINDIVEQILSFQQNKILQAPTLKNPNRQFSLQQNLAQRDLYQAQDINQNDYQNIINIAIYQDKSIQQEAIDWLISQFDIFLSELSPHISVYEQFIIDDKIYIIMESDWISLKDYLNINLDLNFSEKETILLDITKSIQYFHQNNYCHSDIRIENYCIINKQCKLNEFGSIKKLNHYQSKFGTLQKQGYNYNDAKYIDIYCLACLFYEIIQGEKLFNLQKYNQNDYELIQQSINNFKKDNQKYITQIKNIEQKKWQNIILYILNNVFIIELDINQILNLVQSEDQLDDIEQKLSQIQTNQLKDPIIQNLEHQFILSELLQNGTELKIYQAKPINTQIYQTDVAIKIQSKFTDLELKFIDYLIEYQKQQQNKILSIISVYERFQWQKNQIIIMELGTNYLNQVLETQQQLSALQKIQICQQITEQIQFLHQMGIIHRNISPENFIQIGNIFKLIEFGSIKQQQDNLNLNNMVGNPYYQAPEIIMKSGGYSFSIDIWQLGCLFYEIFKGTPLFYADYVDQLNQKILNYYKNQQFIHSQIDQLQIGQKIQNLIKNMLDPNPLNRPKINQITDELAIELNNFQQNKNNFNEQDDIKKQIVNLLIQSSKFQNSSNNKEVYVFLERKTEDFLQELTNEIKKN
ncbi:unnamed protein product [Paramecium sonneborni]|uniref:Protein kinase domain-containing protein n=1 Tax=Paramecium sonneborni TaxID=65129 RepID=A0A8S1NUL6_9CILI|nr:unnamed protein product [Paramecium sonneborni]